MILWGLSCASVYVSGCESRSSTEQASHLAALSRLHSQFEITQRRRPANIDELREFARGGGAAILTEFQVTDVDALFISERDGQPFHLNVGTEAEGKGLFAYEQQGHNGERMVAFMGGGVQLLSDEVFQQLMAEQ